MTPLAFNVPISEVLSKVYTVLETGKRIKIVPLTFLEICSLNTRGTNGSPNGSEQVSPIVDTVHFGTDGWRAIIGEDFNFRSVARVAAATALVYRHYQQDSFASTEQTPNTPSAASPNTPPAASPNTPPAAIPNTILIGYDCRQDAGRYAVLAATVIASYGFDVKISDRYCPTPALCWTIGQDPSLIGGLMLTSSHNPAEYLGIKLRMQDGGASPQAFTSAVESALQDDLPACFDNALDNFQAATNGTPDQPATSIKTAPQLHFTDIMSAYLKALYDFVDAPLIRQAGLKVVVDPLFGAGRDYLAHLLESLGVQVAQVNGANDPSFAGLHPEPILPWVQAGADKVVSLGYDACFVTDGDADRIGALDETGTYVTSHRILALIIGHLVEDRGMYGRVVRTQAGSNLLRRQCDRLGLTLTTRPIGFKWIYQEMLAGDVLIGGEESGGMGIPSHVRERDGLLMALLLTELMAQKGKKLRGLVTDLTDELGTLEYNRRDLRLTPEQKEAFLSAHVTKDTFALTYYQDLFTPLGETLTDIDRSDGIKFNLDSDAWLMIRASGTEPLVRVYAEAQSMAQVQSLLDLGCQLAQG